MKRIVIFAFIIATFLFSADMSAQNAQLILAGTYKGYGDIYSPEIVGNRMYFGGWYNDNDYPCDAIYVTDLKNISHVKRILRMDSIQVNDPSVVGNKIYMTYNPDIYLPDDQTSGVKNKKHKTYGPGTFDITQQKVAVSTIINSDSVSRPVPIIENAWLPSAVKTDHLYLYYNIAGTGKLMRAKLSGDIVVNTVVTTFDSGAETNFYPVNVDVKFYNGMYFLLGDYNYSNKGTNIYSLGLWLSKDGVNFTSYKNNPIILPDSDNIIARTACFIKTGNRLKLWFGQQKKDWWKNAIFYKQVKIKNVVGMK
ncbi:MAG: hypothetical protein ACYDA4_17120 [Ignavibacteriaceae bacterium]